MNIKPDEKTRFEIFIEMGESVSRPKKYWDILFCLNVIDRHPNPTNLIECLRDLLKNEGILFLASPLDWDKNFTSSELWVEDTKSYLSDTVWEVVESKDLKYIFHYSTRKIIQYISQVICAKKR